MAGISWNSSFGGFFIDWSPYVKLQGLRDLVGANLTSLNLLVEDSSFIKLQE